MTLSVYNLKTKETNEFPNWKAFNKWALEEFELEIWIAWRELEHFERRGFEDESHWFTDLSVVDTKEFLWSIDYELIVVN